jgi:transcriptional regulator with GAF, ATPase, and Fis domain
LRPNDQPRDDAVRERTRLPAETSCAEPGLDCAQNRRQQLLPMVEVSQALADDIAEVARLLESDEGSDAALRRLTRLGVELVPGAVAAAVTVLAEEQAHTFAASDPRLDELHRLQFDAKLGPVVETLRYNEPRHARDLASEQRWAAFCQAAARTGFGSCIALPLHTHRQPAGAVVFYADHPHAFRGASHDLALLFAAQGGTAVHNSAVHGACQQMVGNLQLALERRAAIEQAKGIVHAALGIPPEEAFELILRASQNTNQKVRDIAAQIVSGNFAPRQLRNLAGPRPG